jgi:hypothetical protein
MRKRKVRSKIYDQLRAFLPELSNAFECICTLFLEEAATTSENWIQAQLAFRKRKDLMYKAGRELKFREECIEKRTKIRQIRVASDSNAFSINAKRKAQAQDEQDKSEEVEIDDLFLNDEFAPEFVDSEDEDEEADENEPEFHPFRVSGHCSFPN